MSCPYEVLGVDKDCELSAIKKAYRKLSLQYHPDRNSTSEANEKMLQINAAYEEIGDVDQRKSYDNRVLKFTSTLFIIYIYSLYISVLCTIHQFIVIF